MQQSHWTLWFVGRVCVSLKEKSSPSPGFPMNLFLCPVILNNLTFLRFDLDMFVDMKVIPMCLT